MKKSALFRTSVVLGTFALPGLAYSAGFAIVEQNVSGLGNAYAGAGAVSNDASTVYFNPAGMMELKDHEGSFALHAITPSATLSNNNSIYSSGAPISGGNGGDAGGTAIVPNVYYVNKIGNKTKFGIGITAPYGLTTEYDRDWVGRYQAVKSELTTVNINPSLAFRPHAHFSIGVGMNIQYADATLTNAVDFGAVCYGFEAAGAIPAGTCLGAGVAPGSADGFSEVTGDSWSMGFNAGLLFAPNSNSKVGFAYRSRVKHKLTGNADFTLNVPAPLAGNAQIVGLYGAVFQDTGATANLDLPETYSLSSAQMVTPKLQILGDITHTKWSRLSELRVEFDNANKSASVEEMHWKNTYKYSLGANFLANQNLTLRAGFAFDEGAAPNSVYRSARVPDNDRTWYAVGLGYKNQGVSYDFGYVHIVIEDAAINRTGATGETLRGTYDLSVDILSAQVSMSF